MSITANSSQSGQGGDHGVPVTEIVLTVVLSLGHVEDLVHVGLWLHGVEQGRDGGAQHHQTTGNHSHTEHDH